LWKALEKALSIYKPNLFRENIKLAKDMLEICFQGAQEIAPGRKVSGFPWLAALNFLLTTAT
jgi:hypothetical protein